MNLTLPPRLRPLLAEFKGNTRLQVGAVLIALLVFGWLMLVLADWRSQKLVELEQARQRLAQIQGLAGQEVWIERAEAAHTLAQALRAEIPSATSAGLAQAQFQGWLREIVDTQGAPLRLDVEAPVNVEQPAGIVKVTATIAGNLSPARVQQLIHRIEGRTTLSTIPTLTILNDGFNWTFSLTVQGFYQLAPEEPEA